MKREKVTNWGEVEVEDEMDVRSWLVKGSQEEDNISKKKEDDMVSTPMMLTKRMKQLELSWRMHMHPGVVEPAKVENVSTPKVKLTKKEALKKAAEQSKSILDWIKPTQKKEENEVMDWSEDTSIPSGDSIITIERKEMARMRKRAWMTSRMCREEIDNIVSHVEGRSVAGAIITNLVDSAWKEGSRRKIWDMLEADDELKEWTKRKLESEEAEEARRQEEMSKRIEC